jgi:hypothetical protein
MSGFSKDWLLLREPTDRAARSPELASALTAQLMTKASLNFADFGCGTGANLRATALNFRAEVPQCWRLFDNDPRLLRAARETLSTWADQWTDAGSGLRLQKDGRRIEVVFCETDLGRDAGAILEAGEIATASAFFDLVSSDWIARFSRAAAKAGAIVYATLTYNGLEIWSPPHPGDGAMLAAFHAHQRRDKGFGRASGPNAAAMLEEALLGEGYSVKSGDSAWRLSSADRTLIELLAGGSAAAIAELNLFDESAISRWKDSRQEANACVVGHTDVLAFPQ